MPQIAVVGPAASAGFTRDEIVAWCADEFGYDPTDTQFSNTCVRRINRVIDDISSRYAWRFAIQYAKDNITLTAQKSAYKFSELGVPGLDQPGFLFQQATPYLLKYLPSREYFEKLPEQTLTGLSYFYTLHGDDDFLVWPAPATNQNFDFMYYSQFPHLTEGSQRMFWRAKFDQVLIDGVCVEMGLWAGKRMNYVEKREQKYEMGLRRMRVYDACVPDWKGRFRMDRENRSRYGIARDNSRDWGWRY